MITQKRIENLEFRQATYLLPKKNWPSNPSWHIDYFYPNTYYGRENDYIREGDWYYPSKDSISRIHKSCFKSPEVSMAIASFDYDNEGYWQLSFIGDRPLCLDEKEREIFWELIKYGYEQLNNYEDEKN